MQRHHEELQLQLQLQWQRQPAAASSSSFVLHGRDRKIPPNGSLWVLLGSVVVLGLSGAGTKKQKRMDRSKKRGG